MAFSKELLPVGSRFEAGVERPRAVSEYLIERMALAGADKICFVIGPHKSDILAYYGARAGRAHAFYVVQPESAGLCDAIFCALPFVDEDEEVVIGLPDTVWFPQDGLLHLPSGVLSLLLFPVARPELFDAVLTDERGNVLEVQVKDPEARSHWVWGAVRMPGRLLHELRALWQARDCSDPYLGTLINVYLAQGGRVSGVRAGQDYVDVGTLNGYREAIQLLARRQSAPALVESQP